MGLGRAVHREQNVVRQQPSGVIPWLVACAVRIVSAAARFAGDRSRARCAALAAALTAHAAAAVVPLAAQPAGPVASLLESEGALTLHRGHGPGIERPRPILDLMAGDAIVVDVDGEGFALVLYPSGPVRVWPGEQHTVRAESMPSTRVADGPWQKIGRTIGAFRGAKDEGRITRHGDLPLMFETGVRLLVPHDTELLTPEPRLHWLGGQLAPGDSAVRVTIFGDLTPQRCWDGGVAGWEQRVETSPVAVPQDAGLTPGSYYRVEIGGPAGERHAACFRVANPEARLALEPARSQLLAELADRPVTAEVLWATLLVAEGYLVDALATLEDALEQRPGEPAALELRDYLSWLIVHW